MGVYTVVILVDKYNLPDDIFEIVFATPQQKIVGKVLIGYIKQKGTEITKSEMSEFATELHEGKLVTEIDDPKFTGKKVRLSYNKRQFYDRILTPMRGMGLIDYDLYRKKYKISNDFKELLNRIGDMWLAEVRKPVKGK
ncbi:hypothetical protein J4227_07305 [Candidatus Woesearchaeota archaeon]|nr:hypothetical protein [Candidatus Woesearchaeota archaeon]